MTYDPKAKRPTTEAPTDDPAPVDQLLGAVGSSPTDAVEPEPSRSGPGRASDPVPLPAPVPTRRTPKAIAGALVAVAIILLGWRRYRR